MARKFLPVLVLSALVLLGLAWLLVGRTAGPARKAPQPLVAEVAAERPHRNERALDDDLAAARTSVLAQDPPPAEPAPRPAIVTGFLTIDDVPQPGGTVVFRDRDGRWQRTVAIGPTGAFRINDVPIAKLTASFELPPRDGRPIFVPDWDFETRPGQVEDLVLNWKCTQVNVRLPGTEPGSRTSVRVEGPRLHGAIEIDETGRGALSVTGSGHFTFAATRDDGRVGTAELDLEGSEGLETAVVAWNE